MIVIGMVGPFGSGCSFVSSKIAHQRNYKTISLSDELRELYQKDCGSTDMKRSDLQDFGDEIRRKWGADYLARCVYDKMKTQDDVNYIVDSIRNPEEVEFFREKIPNFYLLGIFAEPDIRWNRVKEKYGEDYREFKKDDKRDSGEKFSFGQRVTDSFKIADIILLNNANIVPGNYNEELLNAKLKTYIDLIEGKNVFHPSPMETNMVIAYAVSMRSSCLKRKVGAVIVDISGNVFSSGYNEVPAANNTCKNEYGKCYRDKLKEDYKESLYHIIMDQEKQEQAYKLFKKDFKILDYCRALHAEENAILNVARVGASSALQTATLYTTTYPCNLCANKIAQVGIRHVVYFEPYPMEEAKKILSEKGVKQEPFEGITYKGYFRIMEVVD